MFDVIIGRGEADKQKLGSKGAVLIARHYVKMGRTVSLSNNVYLDVTRAHVFFVVGKRGCLSGDTKVFTNQGYIDIKNFDAEKHKIYSYNENGFEWEKAKLLKYDIIDENLIEVENYDGQKLVMTNEHPLLVLNKGKQIWKNAESLELGDLLLSVISVPKITHNKESLRIARLLGFILADGTMQARKGVFKDGRGYLYTGTKRRVRLVNASEDVLRTCKEDLEKEFGIVAKRTKKEKENCYIIATQQAKVLEKLNSLGIPLGLKSHIIRIPKIVFESSNKFKAEFIKALYSCDGYVNKKGFHVIYYSKSRKFLEDLNLLLTHFSIQSTIRDKIVKLNGKIFHNYQLNVTDHTSLENFKKIGFIDSEKVTKLGRHKFNKIIRRKRTEYMGKNLFGNKILKISKVKGVTSVYDLQVPKNHSFIANGIISHNSGKSYTMGVIAEGISDLPEEIKNNISVILLDTMGIYWTMKYPNQKDKELLDEWGLKPKSLDVKIFTPTGYYADYKKKGIPTDFPFSIKPSELDATDWTQSFGLSANDPISVLIEKVVYGLKDSTDKRLASNFSISDIIKNVESDKESDNNSKNAAKNLFTNARNWGIFESENSKLKATPLSELAKAGQVTVLDLSCYATMANSWNIKSLVVGLISEKLFMQRMTARKNEEFAQIHKSINLFGDEAIKKMEYPMVWLVIDECLPYSSKILTDRGLKEIGKIVDEVKSGKGINVAGFDSKTGNYGFYPVSKGYERPKRVCMTFTTETGQKLTCTPDHKILSKSGWVQIKDAKDIAVPVIKPYLNNIDLVKARLLGSIFGDGWLATNGESVGFSGKGNNDDLLKIKSDLGLLGLKSSSIYTTSTRSEVHAVDRKKVLVNGTSSSITSSTYAHRLFSKLGAPIGTKVLKESIVPSWILNGNDDVKAEFLAGLMGADGYTVKPRKQVKSDFDPIRLSFNKIIELKENGLVFANQLKRLFNDLDVKISDIKTISGNIRKDGHKTVKVIITLAKSVQNTINFLERIGYRYCESKELEGKKMLEYLKYRVYLLEQRLILRNKILQMRKKTGWGKVKIAKQLGLPDYVIREWIYYTNKTGLPKNLPSFELWIKKRLDGSNIFLTILDTVENKEEKVYDLSVDTVHNFIADDFLVHNCHEFLPRDGKTLATDPLVTILREGRQPGISLILASQQPGKVHTDVMTQSDVVIAHRITAKLDTEALGALMQSYMREGLVQQLDDLPRLKGSAIIFDDNNERMYPIRMRPRLTWHGGEDPSAIPKKSDLDEEMEL
jgi:intein/homing endonuclease